MRLLRSGCRGLEGVMFGALNTSYLGLLECYAVVIIKVGGLSFWQRRSGVVHIQAVVVPEDRKRD